MGATMASWSVNVTVDGKSDTRNLFTANGAGGPCNALAKIKTKSCGSASWAISCPKLTLIVSLGCLELGCLLVGAGFVVFSSESSPKLSRMMPRSSSCCCGTSSSSGTKRLQCNLAFSLSPICAAPKPASHNAWRLLGLIVNARSIY